METMVEISNDGGRWVVQIDGPPDIQMRIALDLNEALRARPRRDGGPVYTVAGYRVADLRDFCVRLRSQGVAIYWDDTPGWKAR